MVDAAPEPPLGQARHFPALDGVRGLAILIVLIHNSCWIERDSAAFLVKLTIAIAVTGWVGVQLFFVLSGFLITGILIDALGSPTFFRTFYLRRTLRIFPLYYAFLALVFLVLPHLVSLPAWGDAASKAQWSYWTYLSNWAIPFVGTIPGLPHFWSLAVEEQFYLFWPLVVYSLARPRLIGLCVVIGAVTPVIRLLLRVVGLPVLAAYDFTIARWDTLAIGALLAILLREAWGRVWLRRRMAGITGLALVALASLVLIERGFHEKELSVQVAGQTLMALLSAALIYYSIVPGNGATPVLQRLVSGAWLRFLGKYSYAIYVFHYPIHAALTHYLADSVNQGDPLGRVLKLAVYVACVSALSVLAALVSWRLLEKPCLDLKERLAPRAAAPA